MGDQALIQLAAKQGDAVGAGVVAEEMAGHAGLAAAAAAAPVRPCRTGARLREFERRRRGLVGSQ